MTKRQWIGIVLVIAVGITLAFYSTCAHAETLMKPDGSICVRIEGAIVDTCGDMHFDDVGIVLDDSGEVNPVVDGGNIVSPDGIELNLGE